jgi:hypothetical protein
MELVTNIDLLQRIIKRILRPGGKCFWHIIVSRDTIPNFLVAEVDKWNKYFSLCKTMFSPNKGRSYGNGQHLFAKD